MYPKKKRKRVTGRKTPVTCTRARSNRSLQKPRKKNKKVVFVCWYGNSSRDIFVPDFKKFLKKRRITGIKVEATGIRLPGLTLINPIIGKTIRDADLVVSFFFAAKHSNYNMTFLNAEEHLNKVVPKEKRLAPLSSKNKSSVDNEKTFEEILKKLEIEPKKESLNSGRK